MTTDHPDPSTPATSRLERFARNFRNMGVVVDYDIIPEYNQCRVAVKERGLTPHPVRNKGWEFELTNSYISADGWLMLTFELDDETDEKADRNTDEKVA